MLEPADFNYSSALYDFRRARQKAQLEELMAGLTGKSTHLLSYDEVRDKLRAQAGSSRGLKEIPLDAIVGSVGRYTDFTRNFLPRHDMMQQRWVRVDLATRDSTGLPPIEVYQIGQVYFVLDGNHRVSIARQSGATHIEAYVTEVRTKVPLTPDVTPDDLIIKARYADFLERTRLDETHPEADLSITTPGHYRTLEKQISAHQLVLAARQQPDIPYPQAASDWYDNVYLPVIHLIRAQGILHKFPGRTETDLYVWLLEYRQALTEELGWQIQPQAAVSDLANRFSPSGQGALARVGGMLLEAVTPYPLEAGPPPGQWRRELVETRPGERLFGEVLVALDGEIGGWLALEVALMMAQPEQGRIYSLHVTPVAVEPDDNRLQALHAEFNRRCQAANVPGDLAIEAGSSAAAKICDRARWADLVAVSLTYPPASQRLARLSSGFRTLVRRCPRPILAVPARLNPAFQLERVLLAYDASPKAQEALFVAAYLAGYRQLPLVVLTVEDNGSTQSPALAQATTYLESHGIKADYVLAGGPVAPAILNTAINHQASLITMGGYGSSPVIEAVMGSSVDQVLRQSNLPVLICR